VEIRSIAVLGAGQMGNGIAQVAACAGYDVTMIDIEQEFIERGMDAIERSLGKLVAKERMSREDADSALARVRTSTDKGAASDCDLVIEAIPEIPELKLSAFAELDGICKPEAILASNTSSISIDAIAGATSRPDRVIGMHFMNPVPIMRLVEIINGAQTSDEVNAAVVGTVERMGKTALSCNDSPGIGPLALADFIGLDTVLHIMNVLHEGLADDKYAPAPLLVQMVYEGKLGRKSGQGFYFYE